MIKTICGRLIHLVIAIMLLQSCERETDQHPVAAETSLVKKWYSENGKPFALEWSKLEIIKGNNENTTIIVPFENGLNIGPENAILQNIVFTVDEHGVVKGHKVDLFSNTRTVTEHSKEAMSSFVKKQGYRSQDLAKVYFIVYDFKDNVLQSQMLDAEGLKSIDLRMTSQKKDIKVKEKKKLSSAPATAKIPVVCKDWYLVEYFDDGSSHWDYLYTTCSGTGSSGGGGRGR